LRFLQRQYSCLQPLCVTASLPSSATFPHNSVEVFVVALPLSTIEPIRLFHSLRLPYSVKRFSHDTLAIQCTHSRLCTGVVASAFDSIRCFHCFNACIKFDRPYRLTRSHTFNLRYRANCVSCFDRFNRFNLFLSIWPAHVILVCHHTRCVHTHPVDCRAT